jgi:hypothetical protein
MPEPPRRWLANESWERPVGQSLPEACRGGVSSDDQHPLLFELGLMAAFGPLILVRFPQRTPGCSISGPR